MLNDLQAIKDFMPKMQFAVVKNLLQTSEEKEYFADLMKSLRQTIETMPKTYEQDGLADDALAYLHYFAGGND